MWSRLLAALGVAMLLPFSCGAADDWGPLQFLVGNWTGEGSGEPGQGTGGFSFAPDLQGKILLRKSYSEYPTAQGRPASRHEDLMVVYRDEAKQFRATYYDNEGHVISYRVEAAGSGVVFTSGGTPATTRYRLTYTPETGGKVKIRFEMAAPGKDFAIYVEGTSRRT